MKDVSNAIANALLLPDLMKAGREVGYAIAVHGSELKVGTGVTFIDEHRVHRAAIVTKVWTSVGGFPGCNLVFVSGDETKDDPYGRQIERRTSIVHLSQQPAGVSCWCWLDEAV